MHTFLLACSLCVGLSIWQRWNSLLQHVSLSYLQLFDRRKKHVKSTERSHWEQLSIEYMSLESSDDEDADRIIVHHLPWRSSSECIMFVGCKFFHYTEVKDFLKVLDQRAEAHRQSSKHYSAERKQRCDGVEANTSPFINAPKWTIDREWWNKGMYLLLISLFMVIFLSYTMYFVSL